jgi:hypothetical protein
VLEISVAEELLPSQGLLSSELVSYLYLCIVCFPFMDNVV